MPARCHPVPVTGLWLCPHAPSRGKAVPDATEKGQGRTDSPESAGSCRGELASGRRRAGSGSRGGDSRGRELRGSRRHRWRHQVSPGWVRRTGLVPGPKQGREKQRKHESEPAKGWCKAVTPGPAAASTVGGPGSLPGAGGHKSRRGEPGWTPQPRLSPLPRSSGVERRGTEPGRTGQGLSA